MPLLFRSTISGWWPKTSVMSLRIRRAAAPVSSSASTTMPPLTRWSASAKRSIEDTSALRQQVFVTFVLASSAFTCAVIAMAPTLVAREQTRIRGTEFLRIVDARLARSDVRHLQPGPGRLGRGGQPATVVECAGVDQDGVHPELGGVPQQHLE